MPEAFLHIVPEGTQKEEQKRQREQALLEQQRMYAQQNAVVRPDFTYQDNSINYTNQNSDVNGRSDN